MPPSQSEPEVQVISGQGFSSNIFVVFTSSHGFIVDAGLETTARSLLRHFSSTGAPQLDGIVLTHRHIDHIEGAALLSNTLNIPVYAPAREAEAILKRDEFSTGAAIFGVPLPEMDVIAFEPAEMNAPTPPPLPFLEGFDVIRTPGHTEGSIVLFHRKSRTLFSGDTVFSYGGVGRWDLPTGNFQELRRSIAFLKGLEVESLYPGHGPMVASGGKIHIEQSYSAIEDYI